MDDALSYLNSGGEIAIIDGTNTTLDRREIIRQRVSKEDGFAILWIENSFGPNEIITKQLINSSDIKNSPDYQNIEDFEKRINLYKTHYEPVRDSEGSFIRLLDGGNKIQLNLIYGFLPSKIASFVMNLHTIPFPLVMCRPGETMSDSKKLFGGGNQLLMKASVYHSINC